MTLVAGADSLRRWSLVLLAITAVSLVATLTAGYVTRQSLAEADGWVAHTQEVKVAIADCALALAHGDANTLEEAVARVKRLTADNSVQQGNLARVSVAAPERDGAALEPLFRSMRQEEDRLLVERLERTAVVRARSPVVLIVGGALTALFGATAFWLFRIQSKEVERQRTLFEGIIESVGEGVIAVRPGGELTAINAVARAMWGGRAPQGRWPKDWGGLLEATYEDGSSMKPEDGPLARAMRGEVSEGVVYRVRPAGEPESDGIWVHASAHPIRDTRGNMLAAVTTLRNITEHRAATERLRDQSLTDELTGLLNRRGFMTVTHARMAEARLTKAPFALFYADLNGLKSINDQLGHEQGDRVIVDAARVLRSVFRGGDVVARIGGDEFVAFLPNFAPAARDAVLGRLAAAVRAHEHEDRPFRLSMSYGLTLVDAESDRTLEDLLAEADRRMYERKRERAKTSAPVVRAALPRAD